MNLRTVIVQNGEKSHTRRFSGGNSLQVLCNCYKIRLMASSNDNKFLFIRENLINSTMKSIPFSESYQNHV